MQQLQNEYGEDNLVALYWHVSGDYETAEADERGAYFDVSGIPEADFDAVTEVVGAGTSVINTYRPIVLTRMATETPISMSTTGVIHAVDSPESTWVTATFRVEDTIPPEYGALTAHFVLYEDLSEDYPWTVRDVFTESNITTLNAPGDSIVITKKCVVDSFWNANDLRFAVFIEDRDPKLVINAQLMPDPYNNKFSGTDKNAHEMDYMGEAIYQTVLTNTGVMEDVISVSSAHVLLPDGMGAYDWITYFCDSTGACYFTPHDYTLAPGQSETLDVHVIDNVGNVQGMALTTLTAQSTNDPLAISMESFATFVDLPSILLVDDDDGGVFESYMYDAIANAGYTARVWDTEADGRPDETEISSYWAVFWTTANGDATGIDADNENSLMSYLDGGGNLMLASMEYLSSRLETSPFITDYLHIDSWVNDNGGFIMNGVAGNPVSDGLSLLIIGGDFPVTNCDAVTVSSPAEIAFTTPPGDKGLTVEDGYKVAFLSFPFECVKTDAADPNNQNTLMQRVLDWFQTPSGVEDAEVVRLALRQNYPNPFNPVTRLAFTVPEGAGRVTLTVHNVNGQVVRTLVDEELGAGPALAVWDGTDEAGENLASGIYFAKLATNDESAFTKMTLLK